MKIGSQAHKSGPSHRYILELVEKQMRNKIWCQTIQYEESEVPNLQKYPSNFQHCFPLYPEVTQLE